MEYGYDSTNGLGGNGAAQNQPPQENWPGGGESGAKKPTEMATASMVLGIIGIVTSCCCCIGMFFSSLALILGLLTKTEPEWDHNAKIGVVTGSIGLGISIILTAAWYIIAIMSTIPVEALPLAALIGGSL